MGRLSAQALLKLADSLPQRDRQIVQTVASQRLVTGSQLERLYFVETGKAASRERAARRTLASLAQQHLLLRLERRIGGVRAGSAGHVYALGPIGKRLVAYWQGQGLVRVRSSHEPAAPFVRHSLAVTEQYVRLVEAERAGRCELLSFQREPDCWRPYRSRQGQLVRLKPDAYVRLGVGEFEQHSFLEVDLGSEGRGALLTKCRYYLSYYDSGLEQANRGVFPLTIWLTPTEPRAGLIAEVVQRLPAQTRQLFEVAKFDDAINAVTNTETNK